MSIKIYISLIILVIIILYYYIIHKSFNNKENFNDCLIICNEMKLNNPYEICRCEKCCQDTENASDICREYSDFFSIYNCTN